MNKEQGKKTVRNLHVFANKTGLQVAIIIFLIPNFSFLIASCTLGGDLENLRPKAKETHTVTFEANGGLPAPVQQTVTHGDKAKEPASMTKANSYFGGWYSDEDFEQKWDFSVNKVTEKTILYAHWISVTYTITFNPNGGTAEVTQAAVPHGLQAERPPDPTLSGWAFDNWYIDTYFNVLYNFSAAVVKDIEVYARWVPAISIQTQPEDKSFIAGSISGSLSVSATVTQGAVLTYQWYRNSINSNEHGNEISGATSNDYTIPSDLTPGTYYYFCEVRVISYGIYKRSNPAEITITASVIYNGNENTNGTVPVDSKSPYQNNTIVTVLSNSGNLEKTDYLFVGWNTQADGGGTNYLPNDTFVISANMVLYARWLEGSKGITLHNNTTEITTTQYQFPGAAYGYSLQSALTVTVKNTGNVATGQLTAVLSGIDSACFSITGSPIASIAAGGSGTFTIRPNTGLDGGTYSATVTVSGGAGISASFVVGFTVSAPVITINTHPAITTNVIAGNISGNLSVAASATGGAILNYQWYSNVSNSNVGGEKIESARSSSFAIPTALASGTYYYFCEVGASGNAVEKRSNVGVVNVADITVTFNSNGGSTVEPITIASGSIITAPATPVKTGYECKFGGWYKDNNTFTNPWNFSTDTVTGNITLHAKWAPYAVGDTGSAGGKIFYVNPSGFTVEAFTGAGFTEYSGAFASYTAYYLEAAAANESSSAQWGAYSTLIPSATRITTFISTSSAGASKIGNGRKDTQIIVNFIGINETGRAAQLCANKSNTPGFTDWFLPSLGELNELYKARVAVGMASSGDFWSSSQANSNTAWVQLFGVGLQGYNGKNDTDNVRAVRAF